MQQIEACGAGAARRAGGQDGRVRGVQSPDPADGCHRPETDRVKTSHKVTFFSSDLSGDLSVIYLCPFSDFPVPFSDLSCDLSPNQ